MSGAPHRLQLSITTTTKGCDTCNSKYHPTPACLGLPDSIINTIKEYGGSVFLCVVLFLGWKGEVVVMGNNLALLLTVTSE